DLADAAIAHELAGQPEAGVGALLRADLEYMSRLLDHTKDRLPLGDGQRQRLLAVDVLALAHRLDGHEGVPMVGRGDEDGAQVLAGEQFAEVVVAGHVPHPALAQLARGAIAVAVIDVAHRDTFDALVAQGVAENGPAAALGAADADDAEDGPVGGRLLLLLL